MNIGILCEILTKKGMKYRKKIISLTHRLIFLHVVVAGMAEYSILCRHVTRMEWTIYELTVLTKKCVLAQKKQNKINRILIDITLFSM